MRIETPSWSIELQTGWAAVVADDQSWVRLFFAGTTRNEEMSSTVEAGSAEVSLEIVRRSGDLPVAELAEAIMKRHVRQGEPERSSRLLGGRAALVYSWTDGVQDIETLFVAEDASLFLRIDVSTAAIASSRQQAARRGRLAAEALLGRFTFTEEPA